MADNMTPLQRHLFWKFGQDYDAVQALEREVDRVLWVLRAARLGRDSKRTQLVELHAILVEQGLGDRLKGFEMAPKVEDERAGFRPLEKPSPV